MGTVGVTGDVALSAFACILATEWKHISAMAAPIRPNVRDGFKAVRDSVVDLLRVIILEEPCEQLAYSMKSKVDLLRYWTSICIW